MKAHEICAKAAELVGGERAASHGDKEQNFLNIAQLWNAYLMTRNHGGPLNALDVGHMMILLKVARMQLGNVNVDDYIDAAGYAGCAAEIALKRKQ